MLKIINNNFQFQIKKFQSFFHLFPLSVLEGLILKLL